MKKAEKTRKKIEQTFLSLTLENDQIPNVSEICAAMDIYRSTFYNYYSNVEELMDSVGQDFTDFIDDIFVNIDNYHRRVRRSGEPFSFATVLTPWVPMLRKNNDLIAVYFNPVWNSRYRNYMMQTVYKTTLEILSITTAENRYIAEFISAGTVQYIYAHVLNNEVFDANEFEKVWERVTLLVTPQKK